MRPGPLAKSEPGRGVAADRIRDLCEQIAREFNPEKIMLFGSYARGEAHWDSDVDLLVIMPFTGRPASQASRIRSRIHTPLSVDLLVRTPDQVRNRLALGDFFISEIMQSGKTMYEASHKGMGGQSRR